MDKKLVGLMSIFILSFVLFISIVASKDQLTRFTKAKEEFIPSAETSLILAWPLTTKSDGQSSAQVNVFVRNLNNAPLSNKKVSLSSTLGQIQGNDVVTDKAGKASFNLISETPGTAEISALVDDTVQIKQKVSVKFE
jgi:hypothetical protein